MIVLLDRVVFPNETVPSGLNKAMFIPVLKGQGTLEQQKKWLGPAQKHEIMGTYAQTELGHGTVLIIYVSHIVCLFV